LPLLLFLLAFFPQPSFFSLPVLAILLQALAFLLLMLEFLVLLNL
jgi:hypothetical protein